jgi:hypothetical protein
VATGPECRLLVRVGPQVQEVLWEPCREVDGAMILG